MKQRKCSKCGRSLSTYNKGNDCFQCQGRVNNDFSPIVSVCSSTRQVLLNEEVYKKVEFSQSVYRRVL